MPKRSDREAFSRYFKDNPFEGLSPEQIYDKIKWGNKPNNIITIFAQEPLVSLGYLAELHFDNNHYTKFPDDKIHLAIGANTNYIYLFPKNTKRIPYLDNKWKPIALVKETHYYSDKGYEDCYYYHEHEAPYPVLAQYPGKNIYIILPQNFNGRRSYAVIKEGIVG